MHIISPGKQSSWVRILRSMYKAWQWSNQNFGYARSSVKVLYHDENGTSYFSQLLDEIHIYKDDVWHNTGKYTCAHEWGHALMYERVGFIAVAGCEDHWYYTVTNLECAFTEGWAEFFGMAVWSDEEDYYGKGWVERYSGLWGYPYWRGEDGANTEGIIVEGAVMSYLWDLYDGPQTNDGGSENFDDDGIWNESWKIGHVIDKLERDIFFHVDITDFKDKWDEFGYPNCDEIYNIDLNIDGGIAGNKPPSPNLTNIYFDPNSDVVYIYFTENAINEGGFVVERKQDGFFQIIDTIVQPNANYYVDHTIWNGKYYYYRIRTITADTSHPSNVLDISIPDWNLQVVEVKENYIKIRWNEFFGNEIGIQIWRKKEGENWNIITTTEPNKSEYRDDNVEFNVPYEYKVRAKFEDGYSLFSNIVSATPNVLNPPTLISATSSYLYNKVVLTWHDNSNHEDGYEIYRKGVDGNWQYVGFYDTPGSGTGQVIYTDNSVSQFQDYYYRVIAKAGNVYSSFSNEKWVTTSLILLSIELTFFQKYFIN